MQFNEFSGSPPLKLWFWVNGSVEVPVPYFAFG
jgi:hypothetical protein